MPSAVRLRTDFTAGELRRLAKKAQDVNQSRRLLSLAAVLDGMSRTEAAMIGGWTARPCVTGFTGSMRRAQMGSWTTGRVGRRHAFRQRKKPTSPRSSKGVPTEKSTGSSVGGALISSASSLSSSASNIASATSERFSENSASRTSPRGRVIRPRMLRRWQLIKKFCAHAERPSARSAKGNSYRNLVPGRGPHRSEEWPRPPMGQTWIPTAPACRPALRERLSIRRDLSSARQRRGARTARRRYIRHAASPR